MRDPVAAISLGAATSKTMEQLQAATAASAAAGDAAYHRGGSVGGGGGGALPSSGSRKARAVTDPGKGAGGRGGSAGLVDAGGDPWG